jgi:hypothetical protein
VAAVAGRWARAAVALVPKSLRPSTGAASPSPSSWVPGSSPQPSQWVKAPAGASGRPRPAPARACPPAPPPTTAAAREILPLTAVPPRNRLLVLEGTALKSELRHPHQNDRIATRTPHGHGRGVPGPPAEAMSADVTGVPRHTHCRSARRCSAVRYRRPGCEHARGWEVVARIVRLRDSTRGVAAHRGSGPEGEEMIRSAGQATTASLRRSRAAAVVSPCCQRPARWPA